MVASPDTDERNRSLEERVSRLEGGCEHLATKADIERVLVAVERNRADIIKVIISVAGIGGGADGRRIRLPATYRDGLGRADGGNPTSNHC